MQRFYVGLCRISSKTVVEMLYPFFLRIDGVAFGTEQITD